MSIDGPSVASTHAELPSGGHRGETPGNPRSEFVKRIHLQCRNEKGNFSISLLFFSNFSPPFGQVVISNISSAAEMSFFEFSFAPSAFASTAFTLAAFTPAAFTK
ncbi:hypothetical protein POVWA2_018200 [Plasmodium ovale wallikeri]|uniref:Uncharacterized protein n=1 Tax=Plasmodium ovale wallikeri TaxID=864142 RepID=A0A1A8YRP5_PLAOA|nr:hypothetical protein POVWA2_018200 [Plasmodium ovale wallikeri]